MITYSEKFDDRKVTVEIEERKRFRYDARILVDGKDTGKFIVFRPFYNTYNINSFDDYRNIFSENEIVPKDRFIGEGIYNDDGYWVAADKEDHIKSFFDKQFGTHHSYGWLKVENEIESAGLIESVVDDLINGV